MTTNIRPFGSSAPFQAFDDVDCDWCAARPEGFDGDEPRQVFLESDAGQFRRIVREDAGLGTFWTRCFRATREEAAHGSPIEATCEEVEEAELVQALGGAFGGPVEVVEASWRSQSMEAVTFKGGRVERLGSVRMRHPVRLEPPHFLIQVLEGCDGLLLTALHVGNGENQLAVPSVPAALFEQPLPALTPDTELVFEFANAGDAPASFVVWLGSREAVRLKFFGAAAGESEVIAKMRKKPGPKPKGFAIDPELHALATVLHALQPLKEEQRERVINYARRWIAAHAVGRG